MISIFFDKFFLFFFSTIHRLLCQNMKKVLWNFVDTILATCYKFVCVVLFHRISLWICMINIFGLLSPIRATWSTKPYFGINTVLAYIFWRLRVMNEVNRDLFMTDWQFSNPYTFTKGSQFFFNLSSKQKYLWNDIKKILSKSFS